MEDIHLHCGKNGDILCGVRKGEQFCPYYDNEDCRFYRPDIVESKRRGRGTSKNKGMSLEGIAQVMQQLSQQYLDGEIPDDVFRPLAGAVGMAAMRISPRQAEAMLNAAKMDVVIKQLQQLDTPEKIAESLKKSQEAVGEDEQEIR